VADPFAETLSPFTSAPGPVRPLRGLAVAAAVCIALSVFASGALSWTQWLEYRVAADFAAGTATLAEAYMADRLSGILRWVVAALTVLDAAVFLGWLWRARLNAESLSLSVHRLGRGWVVGAWICPIVNLWYPLIVLADIWKTSRPGPTATLDLAKVRGSRLVTTWWVLSVLAGFVTFYATTKLLVPVTADDLYRGWRDYLIASGTRAIAAILLVFVIARITIWHSAHTEFAP